MSVIQPYVLQMYGFLFGMNRNKPSTLEVVVDTWPDFKVIICRPDAKVILSSRNPWVVYINMNSLISGAYLPQCHIHMVLNYITN